MNTSNKSSQSHRLLLTVLNIQGRFKKTCTNPNISFRPLFIFTSHDYETVIKVPSSSNHRVGTSAITYDVNIVRSSFISRGADNQCFGAAPPAGVECFNKLTSNDTK